MSSSSDYAPGRDRAAPFASLSDGTPPRRFSLFDFLVAPFRDVDDRAHYAPGNQRSPRAKNGAANNHANGHNGRAANGNGHANGFAPLTPSARRLYER